MTLQRSQKKFWNEGLFGKEGEMGIVGLEDSRESARLNGVVDIDH